jgi:hypothetical protein
VYFGGDRKGGEETCPSQRCPKSADAIQQGIARAGKTLRHVRSAWVKEQHVRCNEGKITEYQVNMMVTFLLDE